MQLVHRRGESLRGGNEFFHLPRTNLIVRYTSNHGNLRSGILIAGGDTSIRLVRPLALFLFHLFRPLYETGFTDSRSVLQSKINPPTRVDFHTAFPALFSINFVHLHRTLRARLSLSFQ